MKSPKAAVFYCTSYSSSVHWVLSAIEHLFDRSYQLGIQGGIKKSFGRHSRIHQALSCASYWYRNSCVSLCRDLRTGSLTALGLSDPIALQRNAGLLFMVMAQWVFLVLMICRYVYNFCSVWGSSGVFVRYNTKGHVVYMPEYAGITADDSVAGGNSLRLILQSTCC